MSDHRRGIVVLSFVGALLAGAGVAVQTSFNGHLTVAIGSPIATTAINHGTGLAFGLVAALATGAFPRAWRTFRRSRALFRWWWLLGGLMSFGGMFALILATPEVGVVTVTVAITLGQLSGSVFTDAAGFGPGGRRSLGLTRFLGLGLAVVAILVGAVGRIELGNVVLLVLVVVAGAVIAIQQAVNGWWIVITGEWSVMLVINFFLSCSAIGVATLIANALQPIDWASTPWWAWAGGLVGVVNGVAIAYAVRFIGLLSTMLCIAAGQAVAAIVADLVLPVDAIGVTIWSALAALLAVAAVALAGLGSLRRAPQPEVREDRPAAIAEGAEDAD